jgi:beta-aspartyl-dipeptidase (metallo-type)
MFTVIEGGETFAPEPLGRTTLLIAGGVIAQIGDVDSRSLLATKLDVDVIDANGCVVVPGFIDPHQHLIGAGGEQGYLSRQPEVRVHELLRAGITTVVGCLGTDTITRHPAALLGRVRQLASLGFNAYMFTGGFPVPPVTITDSVERDLVLIPEVIGLGEVAIADPRSSQPTSAELATLVAETAVAGSLSGKAGVTHLHVGPGSSRLALLRELLDEWEVLPRQLYPTHINRSAELLDEAVELARRGCFVDIDTVDSDADEWIQRYRERDGPPDCLTVSSDAHTPGGSPHKLHELFVRSVLELKWPIESTLPYFTRNPARALGLLGKGELAKGCKADVVVLDGQSMKVRHLIARGRCLVRDGAPFGELAC